MRLANVEIDYFEFSFVQRSDTSYTATAHIKNIRSDDLRETHKKDAVIHMIDRHFTVDPNTDMLRVNLVFKPKDQTNSEAQKQICNLFDNP